jgi:hypothetical protein
MRRAHTKQAFKIRVLALVLALALIWYSLNPVPGPVIHSKRDDDSPDEKKRNIVPQSMAATLPVTFGLVPARASPLASTDAGADDDFEWPEFIDG